MKGFSLIELLYTFVIIGLIIYIAYPNYTTYITHARRLEGQLALLNLANDMEKYYLEHGNYSSTTIHKSLLSWYSLSMSKVTKQGYQLQASALGQQAVHDSRCSHLTLSNTGQKRSSDTFFNKTISCWS